jgi:hypothetical protein
MTRDDARSEEMNPFVALERLKKRMPELWSSDVSLVLNPSNLSALSKHLYANPLAPNLSREQESAAREADNIRHAKTLRLYRALV